MILSKAELEDLAEKHQKKADRAFRNYQETGITRYETTYRQNDDLAEALRMAANAADDHQALSSMRAQMSWFASQSRKALQPGLEESDRADMVQHLLREIVAYGQAMSLISQN